MLRFVYNSVPSQQQRAEKAQSCGARLVSTGELFRSADILTIHLVLTVDKSVDNRKAK
jgi:hypothetical protein